MRSLVAEQDRKPGALLRRESGAGYFSVDFVSNGGKAIGLLAEHAAAILEAPAYLKRAGPFATRFKVTTFQMLANPETHFIDCP
jgi:hypothetical protein